MDSIVSYVLFLFSTPVVPVRFGVEPLRLLVFIARLISILSISTDYYGVSIEGRGVPCFFCPLLFVLKPSYACTLVDRSISTVLVVTIALPQTIEMS
jgi:hypothetical protein